MNSNLVTEMLYLLQVRIHAFYFLYLFFANLLAKRSKCKVLCCYSNNIAV